MRDFHNLPFTEPSAVDAVDMIRVPADDMHAPGHLIQQYPSGAVMSAVYPDYSSTDEDGMVGMYKGGSDAILHAAGR